MKSKGQMKILEYLKGKGKIQDEPQEEYGDEMEDKEHFATGGFVQGQTFDEQEGNVKRYVSSGEPNLKEDYEEEHPMEYMAMGGSVRIPGTRMQHVSRYAKGGMIEHLEEGEHEPMHSMENGMGGDDEGFKLQNGYKMPSRNMEYGPGGDGQGYKLQHGYHDPEHNEEPKQLAKGGMAGKKGAFAKALMKQKRGY